MALTGEEIQALGSSGSERAKRWLEATCRAEVKWNNPGTHIKKLQFRKAGADPNSTSQGDYFSMDLAGTLLGGEADGDMFVAEVKNYTSAGDQGTEYRYFLARCYRIESDIPNMYEHYLWVTWAPFLVSSWKDLLTKEFVVEAVETNTESARTALGSDNLSDEIAAAVAKKILIVVLSERQEVFLSLHGDELIGVRQALLKLRNNA